MNQFKNSKVRTFKDNTKYFKFVNRDDIVVLDVSYTQNRAIRVRWCKKVGRPKKVKEEVKS